MISVITRNGLVQWPILTRLSINKTHVIKWLFSWIFFLISLHQRDVKRMNICTDQEKSPSTRIRLAESEFHSTLSCCWSLWRYKSPLFVEETACQFARCMTMCIEIGCLESWAWCVDSKIHNGQLWSRMGPRSSRNMHECIDSACCSKNKTLVKEIL